jgi:phosphate transport system permease protein
MARHKIGWNGLMAVGAWAAPVIVAGLFLWLLVDVAIRGWFAFVPGSLDASGTGTWLQGPGQIVQFLTSAPLRAGRAGGIAPILVSTGLILSVCLAVSFPIGIAAALFLSEVVSEHHRFGRFVRCSLDVLAGVPSIVFGLFGNALFCRLLGFRFSILAGGLTLACMVLPLLIRSAEESFRAVPISQRQAAAALGFSRCSTLFRVVIPQASGGIAVGLILGIGRALAETAALIFTSGYVDRTPTSLFDSGRSLSIHIYELSMNVPGGNRNAYASALVLIVLLVIINALAQWLTARFLQRQILPI